MSSCCSCRIKCKNIWCCNFFWQFHKDTVAYQQYQQLGRRRPPTSIHDYLYAQYREGMERHLVLSSVQICIAAPFVRELRKIPVLNFLLELLELICPLSAVRQYIFTRNREGSDEQILWKQIRCKSNYLTSDKTYDGGAMERSCERKSAAKTFSNDYKVFQLELAFW